MKNFFQKISNIAISPPSKPPQRYTPTYSWWKDSPEPILKKFIFLRTD